MAQISLAGEPILLKHATTGKEKKVPPPSPTRREGVYYVSPNGSIFEEPKLTLEYISEISQSNIYAKGVLNKLLWLIFTGEPTIEIKDPAGKVVPPSTTPNSPTVYDDMKRMLESPAVDLWCNMQQALSDCFWWGNNITNPVWLYVDNVYTLTELNRCAPESFCYEPAEGEIYNPLLKGITLKNGKPVYYFQDDEGNSKPLKSYHSIQPPLSTKLGGTPMIQPLLLTIGYLTNGWVAMGQTMNRAGAPSIWLRVTDGDEETFAYCREILKNWGKNTSFPLPENVEIIDPHITEPQNTQEAIKLLQNLLIDYFSPVSLLNSGEGGSLFDSSSQKTALVMAFIQGMHAWLEDGFEKLLRTYLIANRYEGYSLRIILPMPLLDTTESDQKWVEILTNAQTPIADENEIRKFVPGFDQLDEAGLAKLRERTQANITEPKPALVSNAVTMDTPAENEAYDKLRTKADEVKAAVIEDLRKQGFAI